ncbi:MAG: type II toxin-antitoxin system HipA family toxin [Parachlamydiaceae bacterium]
MMSDPAVLDIFLYEKAIGVITNLPGDRNVLSFNQEYIDDPQRPILSLSFRDTFGDLITDIKSTRTRLPPFFANLLPEGHMRDYLASQANVNQQREFYLLAALGKDLPGALKVLPASSSRWGTEKNEEINEIVRRAKEDSVLRFSLAGVQLKFSAVWEREGGLTIPVDGVGGAWIVKLPSSVYTGVPENEYVMMELARHIGINVPETALVPIDQIHGLPKNVGNIANHAFITKRFDRSSDGKGIHIEDFAQIFGVYPEKKYQTASYQNIAQVISAEVGEEGIIEFIRRFIFNALIGNGDMHLKNWSLIYPDKKNAALAPAYDFVSTIPYIPADQLALSFADSKAFSSLSEDQLRRFAAKSHLPEKIVLETARETVVAFAKLWRSINDFPLDKKIIEVINAHLKTIPLFHP